MESPGCSLSQFNQGRCNFGPRSSATSTELLGIPVPLDFATDTLSALQQATRTCDRASAERAFEKVRCLPSFLQLRMGGRVVNLSVRRSA